MKTPTILFCDNNYLALQYDPWFKSGGATKQVVAWVEGLKALGVNVTVLGAHAKPEFFRDCANTMICYDPTKGIPKLRYLYIRIPGILRAVFKVKPDYIYHGVPSPFAGMLAICARLLGKRFILRVSNDFFVDGRAAKQFDPLRNFFFRMGFKFSNYILCQNDYQLEKIREKYATKAFKIANPYFGVIAETSPSFEDRKGVAWIGIFQSQKNLSLLLRIVKAMPDLEFNIAGCNNKSLGSADQAALEELRGLPNARFLGFLNKEEVLALLDKSRILLNTSHYEGFSNTFLEAFSRGTPVFTLPQNDPDRIIEARGLGGVFRDPDVLISKIREFTGDRVAFEKCAENCIRYMKQNHDLATQAEDFLKIVNRDR